MDSIGVKKIFDKIVILSSIYSDTTLPKVIYSHQNLMQVECGNSMENDIISRCLEIWIIVLQGILAIF